MKIKKPNPVQAANSTTAIPIMEDATAHAIQQRGKKYITDVCFIKPDEVIGYLYWLLNKHGKKLRLLPKQVENLAAFLTGKPMPELAKEMGKKRQGLYEGRHNILSITGMTLPKYLFIDNREWSELFCAELLRHMKIPHDPIRILYPPRTKERDGENILRRIRRTQLREFLHSRQNEL